MRERVWPPLPFLKMHFWKTMQYHLVARGWNSWPLGMFRCFLHSGSDLLLEQWSLKFKFDALHCNFCRTKCTTCQHPLFNNRLPGQLWGRHVVAPATCRRPIRARNRNTHLGRTLKSADRGREVRCWVITKSEVEVEVKLKISWLDLKSIDITYVLRSSLNASIDPFMTVNNFAIDTLAEFHVSEQLWHYGGSANKIQIN